MIESNNMKLSFTNFSNNNNNNNNDNNNNNGCNDNAKTQIKFKTPLSLD